MIEHRIDYGWRRQAADGRHWIHGTIDIQPNDVLFVDGSQPPAYKPPEQNEVPDLETDLARDSKFLDDLQDDRFARAVYTVFYNRTFYKGADERSWTCGTRKAARLVRDLRGLGESYQDWFPDGELAGTYPDDRPEREALLRKMIKENSQPIEQNAAAMVSRWPQLKDQLETALAEIKQQLPELERRRSESVASFQRSLATLDENVDVFSALHAHLTRLGWRTERAEDRERVERRRRADALAVLRDLTPAMQEEIRRLELRPQSAPGGWVESLGEIRGPLRIVSAADQPSEEEKEVRRLRKRLVGLPTSGRISEEEYETLSARLRGHSGIAGQRA
jgi:hypothetical protein